MSDEKKAKSVSLWLAASLAINAALLGVVGGHLIAGDKQHGPRVHKIERGERSDRGFERFPKEHREEIRKALSALWKASEAERLAIAAAHEDVDRIVRTNPLDQDALVIAIEDLEAKENILKMKGLDAIIDIASEAEPEERAIILERFSRPMIRMRHKKPKGSPPHGPDGGPPPPYEGGPEDAPPPPRPLD